MQPAALPLTHAASILPDSGIYGWSYGTGGVHYHRIAEPLRVAAAAGSRVGNGQRLDDEVIEKYDTILVHMLWDEHSSIGWRKLAQQGRHRLIFDIDDVMWSPDWEPFAKHYDHETLTRIFRNISMAHVVTTPSTVIAEYLTSMHQNVYYVPNTVPEYLTHLSMGPRPAPLAAPEWRRAVPRDMDTSLTIGYQGSPSHLHDFPAWLMRDLLDVLDDCPEVNYHFWGPDQIPGWPPLRVGHTPWTGDVRAYHHSLSMDMGIGPLKNSAFNRGKSALRAIEYCALGIVPVLADLEPYHGWIDNGQNGFLVPYGASWRGVLTDLVRQPLARARMSEEGRRRALAWTTEANLGTWMEAWNSV